MESPAVADLCKTCHQQPSSKAPQRRALLRAGQKMQCASCPADQAGVSGPPVSPIPAIVNPSPVLAQPHGSAPAHAMQLAGGGAA